MAFRRPGPRPALDAAAGRRVAGDLLSRRPWTVAGLAARLRERGVPADIADDIVTELAARGHLDDAAFARHWVEARAGRGYGVARLRAELRARGVASPLIAQALDRVTRDGALAGAQALARRRLAALVGIPPERRGPRLRAYLLRRGYGADTAARVARELTGEATPDAD